MSRSKRKLRNYLINPKFQLKFIALLFLSGLLLVVSHLFLFYTTARENYKLVVDIANVSSNVKAQMYQELNDTFLYMTLGSILFIILVSIIGIIFSHRAAGPIFRMKKTFEEVADGSDDLKIRIRPTDEFQDLVDSYNLMLDKLKERGKLQD